jgi:predicted RNase H-like HicB family nuclease
MSRAHVPNGDDNASVDVSRDGDVYVAVLEGAELASQGRTVAEALSNLAEALRLRAGEGEAVDPQEEADVLADLGIDPDEVAAAREEHDHEDLPDSMQ